MDQGIWNLETLWFVLIAVLWIGFFFLEGFDFGGGTGGFDFGDVFRCQRHFASGTAHIHVNQANFFERSLHLASALPEKGCYYKHERT